MQVTVFLREIPTYVSTGLHFCAEKGMQAKRSISTFGQQKIKDFSETELWQDNLKPMISPLHERTIARLNKLDYAVLAGTMTIAISVSSYALFQLGVAALPLAAGGSALLIMIPYYFSGHRINKHYSRQAAEKLREIVEELNPDNSQNLQNSFTSINQKRTELKGPEYSHLENFLKEFDEELRIFQNATLSSGRDITETSLSNAKHVFKEHAEEIIKKINR